MIHQFNKTNTFMKTIKYFGIGQTVTYNGQSHIVKSIDYMWERVELFNLYVGSSYFVSVSLLQN